MSSEEIGVERKSDLLLMLGEASPTGSDFPTSFCGGFHIGDFWFACKVFLVE